MSGVIGCDQVIIQSNEDKIEVIRVCVHEILMKEIKDICQIDNDPRKQKQNP